MQTPYPPLYIGGSSPPGHQLAAEQTDLYLTWGEPPAQVAEKIADVRRRAALVGRTLRFGIRLHLIVRETDEEAWAAADGLIAHLSDEVIAAAQHKLTAESDSEGQRRMVALHGGNRAQAGGQPKSVGRRGSGAGRRGHGAGGLAGDGARRASRNTGRSASIPSSAPAFRIWRKPIASPNCCSRCSTSRRGRLSGDVVDPAAIFAGGGALSASAPEFAHQAAKAR